MARRLTKVVFACRSAGGAAISARLSASFSLSIAPRASLPLATSEVRSSLRSAIAPNVFEPATRKRESETESFESSSKSFVEVLSDGFRNL